MFFGHVRPCKCKLHCDTLIFIKKTIIVNDYARCNILILLQTLILCGKMNEWTHYLLHIYIFYFLFCCSLFTRLKTMAMEMELVQQSEKEKTCIASCYTRPHIASIHLGFLQMQMVHFGCFETLGTVASFNNKLF